VKFKIKRWWCRRAECVLQFRWWMFSDIVTKRQSFDANSCHWRRLWPCSLCWLDDHQAAASCACDASAPQRSQTHRV